MGFTAAESIKDEKINGEIYNMSPAPGYRHGIVNNNINTIIKYGLKNSLCLVFMENLDFKYHPEENDDYVCPDIMVICDKQKLRGSTYSGVPKFIAETLSPSTAKRDKTVKKAIYENAGVEEYWIVSPQGSVEIYYLENGKYEMQQSYMLEKDKEDEHYNAETVIRLRAFPHIKMELQDIFENID
ncbi:Uma2 family endonuclease [bacterium D16-51]|nr:Uma2 family endonuclease [bacterium D16-59]RKI58349.1 Uma2 family endonuclease [bacterium D16-51]